MYPANQSLAVLLVDDDPALLRGLTRNLEEMNFTVHSAISAAEALVVLNRHRVHVVVCDYKMTGISGLSFLEKVTRQNPHLATIMLTGEVAELNMALKWANAIGVHKVLAKPCCPEILAQEISNAAIAKLAISNV